MAVRPFYVKAYVLGRKTDIGFGPRNTKNGEMILTLTIREKGEISETRIKISCLSDKGENRVMIYEDAPGRNNILYDKTFEN